MYACSAVTKLIVVRRLCYLMQRERMGADKDAYIQWPHSTWNVRPVLMKF